MSPLTPFPDDSSTKYPVGDLDGIEGLIGELDVFPSTDQAPVDVPPVKAAPTNSQGAIPITPKQHMRKAIQEILLKSQNTWLKCNEVVELLHSCVKEGFIFSTAPAQLPPGGSLYLYDRVNVKYFRNDGHNWRKKGDGRAVRETHEKLKLDQIVMLNCYYAHAITPENLQRRCYWLLDSNESYVLVHYLQVTPDSCRKGIVELEEFSQQQPRRNSISLGVSDLSFSQEMAYVGGHDWMGSNGFVQGVVPAQINTGRLSLDSRQCSTGIAAFSPLFETEDPSSRLNQAIPGAVNMGSPSLQTNSSSVASIGSGGNHPRNIASFENQFIKAQPVPPQLYGNCESTFDSSQPSTTQNLPVHQSHAEISQQYSVAQDWTEPFNLNSLAEPLEKSLFEMHVGTTSPVSPMPSASHQSELSDEQQNNSVNSSLRGTISMNTNFSEPGQFSAAAVQRTGTGGAADALSNLQNSESLGQCEALQGLLPSSNSMSDLWRTIHTGFDSANTPQDSLGLLDGSCNNHCLAIRQMCPEVLTDEGNEMVLMLIGGAESFDFSCNYLCVSIGGIIVEPITVNDNVVKFQAPNLPSGEVKIRLIGIMNGNQQILSDDMTVSIRNRNWIQQQMRSFQTGCDADDQRRLIRSLLSRSSAHDILSGLVQ